MMSCFTFSQWCLIFICFINFLISCSCGLRSFRDCLTLGRRLTSVVCPSYCRVLTPWPLSVKTGVFSSSSVSAFSSSDRELDSPCSSASSWVVVIIWKIEDRWCCDAPDWLSKNFVSFTCIYGLNWIAVNLESSEALFSHDDFWPSSSRMTSVVFESFESIYWSLLWLSALSITTSELETPWIVCWFITKNEGSPEACLLKLEWWRSLYWLK